MDNSRTLKLPAGEENVRTVLGNALNPIAAGLMKADLEMQALRRVPRYFLFCLPLGNGSRNHKPNRRL